MMDVVKSKRRSMLPYAAITPMRFNANAVKPDSRFTVQTPGPLQAPSDVAGRVGGCNLKGCRIAGKFWIDGWRQLRQTVIQAVGSAPPNGGGPCGFLVDSW